MNLFLCFFLIMLPSALAARIATYWVGEAEVVDGNSFGISWRSFAASLDAAGTSLVIHNAAVNEKYWLVHMPSGEYGALDIAGYRKFVSAASIMLLVKPGDVVGIFDEHQRPVLPHPLQCAEDTLIELQWLNPRLKFAFTIQE